MSVHKFTEAERSVIVSALMVATYEYLKCSRTCPELIEQFQRQAAQSEVLAERIENAEGELALI